MAAAKSATGVRPTRARKNGETIRMKAVKEAADAVGLHLYRFNTSAPPIVRDGQRIMRRGSFNSPGVADFIGWAPGGRFVAIEVKDAGGVLRDEQALFLDHVTTTGGVALVAVGAGEVLLLADAAKAAGGWYGVLSPFALPSDTRMKLRARVAMKAAQRAARR